MVVAYVWTLIVIMIIVVVSCCMYNDTFKKNEKFVPIGYNPARVVSDEQTAETSNGETGPQEKVPKPAVESISQIEPYDSTQTYGTIEHVK